MRAFLEKCRKLKEAGFEPEFERGTRLARGYADLGMELFVLLSAEKLLSLHTGQQMSLPEEDRRYFICVPSCDEMVEAIQRRGFDIGTLDFVEQRKWRLKVRSTIDDREHEFSAHRLEDVLADALTFALERDV